MAIQWSTLKSLMLQAMDEAEVDIEIDRTPQMEWAMRTFAQHTPHQGLHTETVSGKSFIELPGDCLDMRGVYLFDGNRSGWVPCLGARPNGGTSYQGAGWWLWPSTRLNLLNIEGDLELYYYAHYPKIQGEEQMLPLPDWAIHPLIWLSVAYALIPTSVATSSLARWMKSGDAEDNPILRQIEFFLKQYEWEMSHHPAVERELIVPDTGGYGR